MIGYHKLYIPFLSDNNMREEQVRPEYGVERLDGLVYEADATPEPWKEAITEANRILKEGDLELLFRLNTIGLANPNGHNGHQKTEEEIMITTYGNFLEDAYKTEYDDINRVREILAYYFHHQFGEDGKTPVSDLNNKQVLGALHGLIFTASRFLAPR